MKKITRERIVATIVVLLLMGVSLAAVSLRRDLTRETQLHTREVDSLNAVVGAAVLQRHRDSTSIDSLSGRTAQLTDAVQTAGRRITTLHAALLATVDTVAQLRTTAESLAALPPVVVTNTITVHDTVSVVDTVQIVSPAIRPSLAARLFRPDAGKILWAGAGFLTGWFIGRPSAESEVNFCTEPQTVPSFNLFTVRF